MASRETRISTARAGARQARARATWRLAARSRRPAAFAGMNVVIILSCHRREERCQGDDCRGVQKCTVFWTVVRGGYLLILMKAER